MRLTLDTDASTLTHPVQLCLVAIPMIVPSTYRKRTHFPSSKTLTSGYDSLTFYSGRLRRTPVLCKMCSLVVCCVKTNFVVCLVGYP